MHRTYGSRIRRYINIQSNITQIVLQWVDQSWSALCLPFASVDIRFHLLSISSIPDYSNLAYSDLQYIYIRPFSHWCFGILWSQLTPRYELFVARTFGALPRPPRVRRKSFTAQPLDLLSWRYVYLLGFYLLSNLARHIASYPVSVRRLSGFAAPLPPPKHCCFRLVVRYTWR